MLGALDSPRVQLRALSWWYLAFIALVWLSVLGVGALAAWGYFTWEPEPCAGTLADQFGRLGQNAAPLQNTAFWVAVGATTLAYLFTVPWMLSAIALRWPSWLSYAFLAVAVLLLMATAAGLPLAIATILVLGRKPVRRLYRESSPLPPAPAWAAAAVVLAPLLLGLVLLVTWVDRATSFSDAPVRAEAERILRGAGSIPGAQGIFALHEGSVKVAYMRTADEAVTLLVLRATPEPGAQ
ncbi:MAG: hypothetical protein HY319_08100 [Armatimonadetes bacterium]|nr:hypothetical protein [Armatimonadota bacterium]